MRTPRLQKLRDTITKALVPRGQPAEPPHTSAGDDLRRRIEKRAYERYVQRGARQGSALTDWLEAEQEILQQERRA